MDVVSCRARPDEWADYIIAKQMVIIVNTRMPCRPNVELMENAYAERTVPN